MPIGVSVWRIEAGKAIPVSKTPLSDEKQLEEILEADLAVLGLPNALMLVGRQVITDFSGRVDLLAIDQEGTLYVIEIKKDRTPREVVAQAMDYGYWVGRLGYDDVQAIYSSHHRGADFEDDFRKAFELEPPEAINVAHELVIVASALDPASERIVTYAKGFGMPLNVVFFQAFQQNGAQYLTRTWLIDPSEEVLPKKASQNKKLQEPWNGLDWYVSFGEDESRNWEDARRYGFVSAGGGPWYTGTLRKLPVGGRIFVNLPGRGYVGVGTVSGQAQPARSFHVSVEGVPTPIAQAPLAAEGVPDLATKSDDETEWFVPVTWTKTIPASHAISFKGKFGNQNSATRLRHALTRQSVLDALGISEASSDGAIDS